jgi:lipopolysaccharide biosynthesis protein
MSTSIRTIAIHLPQFHPIPENDEWWGKGFTEWTNVTKARPLFKDHYQPHLPADLGFYDLRLEEARMAQAELARAYGIYGFCYYHYWFNGRRILERPVNEILKSDKPDFPFCLCWANENWTRRWDGQDHQLLLTQEYNEEDDRVHMEYLCRNVFSDSRYIRVDGKPVFIVYRTNKIPDPRKTADIWRETAIKEGIGEIYLCRMETGHFPAIPSELGFDAAIKFQPDIYNRKPLQPNYLIKFLHQKGIVKSNLCDHLIYDYRDYVADMMERQAPNYKLYPGIMPSWDNSARVKSNAVIFKNATPELYEKWLRQIKSSFKPFSTDENFIFINAWNEWAEGNHLEPCQHWGRRYLEATKKVFEKG